MSGLLTILIIVGYFALQFYSSMKKQREESSKPRAAAEPVADVAEQEQGSVADWISQFLGEEKEEEPSAYEPSGFQREYFTYETVEAPKAERSEPVAATMPTEAREAERVKTAADNVFDLRQAVIYQTILNRVEC